MNGFDYTILTFFDQFLIVSTFAEHVDNVPMKHENSKDIFLSNHNIPSNSALNVARTGNGIKSNSS